MDYFGLIGLSLILLGWLIETRNVLKSRKINMKIQFPLLYCIGSFFLTIYSILQGDIIFIILNGAATLMALFNIYLILFLKEKWEK